MCSSDLVSTLYGKDLVFTHNDLYDEYLHSFTIHVQAIAPSRSIIPYKLNGQLGSTNIVEHVHSLGGYREMIYHSGCEPKAPNITHLLKSCEKTMRRIKCWGNHLPYHNLRQSRDILCWFHMWDYDPPPLLHLMFYVSLVLILYVYDLIIVGDMIGGMTHWLDVAIGNGTSHTSSCLKGIMGHYVANILYHLFPYEVRHMIRRSLSHGRSFSMNYHSGG